MTSDGGHNIHAQLSLSGEPFIPELRDDYGDAPTPPAGLIEYETQALKRIEYRSTYMEYWNSTAQLTGTGRFFAE